MRVWRALGGVLVFLGCLAALMGILATVAPMVDNDQVRRIIESFSIRSHDPLLSSVNGAILFCLRNSYLLFAAGAAAMLAGGLTRAAASGALHKGEDAASPREPARERRPVTVPVAEPARERPVLPKREPGLSPYTAAAYGKALSGGQSDIAAKYMPRSIIDTPAPAYEPAQADAARRTEQPSRLAATEIYARPTANAEADWKLGETVYCRACGAANPWQAAFCDQCGRRLTDGAAAGPSTAMGTGMPETGTDARAAYAPPERRTIPAGETLQQTLTYAGQAETPAAQSQANALTDAPARVEARDVYQGMAENRAANSVSPLPLSLTAARPASGANPEPYLNGATGPGRDGTAPFASAMAPLERASQDALPNPVPVAHSVQRASSPAMARAAGIHARPLIVSTLRVTSPAAEGPADRPERPTAPQSGRAAGVPGVRPRIVSTIGKRSTR